MRKWIITVALLGGASYRAERSGDNCDAAIASVEAEFNEQQRAIRDFKNFDALDPRVRALGTATVLSVYAVPSTGHASTWPTAQYERDGRWYPVFDN